MKLSWSLNMQKGAISNLKDSWPQVNKADPCSIIDHSHKNTMWRSQKILYDILLRHGSACIFMEMFCIWNCMSQRLVFLTFISLRGTFTRAFRSWILCSLSILRSFLYNVFRLSSSSLTSHIRGHLL